jgi:cytochrome c
MSFTFRCGSIPAILVAVFAFSVAGTAAAAGDPKRGAQVFQACAACHSVKPGEHLTGPSLARVWNRKAGTVEGFHRYSDALKRAGIVWNDAVLDKWLADPGQLVPGTSMTFDGLRESRDRDDVIAYLRAASEGKAPSAEPRRGGMMMQSSKVNLKRAPPAGQVVSIRHCGDTYTVETADGKVSKVWEFNLRFKTDSSKDGPPPGKPVIVGAGMQGDRASVVFAAPSEISGFIQSMCK